MIKKSLLTIGLLVSFAQADILMHLSVSPEGDYDQMALPENKTFYFDIEEIDGDRQFGKNDWVALFKKGAASISRNVISWKYVKNVENQDIFQNIETFEVKPLKAGSYELRYFVNNSYNVKSVAEFRVLKNNADIPKNVRFQVLNMFGDDDYDMMKLPAGIQHIFAISKDENGAKFGFGDWVAIYKKGAANINKNVIFWKRITENEPFIDLPKLPVGDYEIRYYRNNNYEVLVSQEFRIVKVADDTPKNIKFQIVDIMNGNYDKMELPVGMEHIFDISKDPNGAKFGFGDWVAIYKKGATNENKNVISWQRITEAQTWIRVSDKLPAGDYDIRYYRNNNYEVLASDTFRLVGKSNNIPKNITFTVLDMINGDGNADLMKLKANQQYTFIIDKDPNGAKFGYGDWVAVYKKGADNVSKNVITWTYIKENQPFLDIKLPKGDYEIRYYRNNNYKVLASAVFKIN